MMMEIWIRSTATACFLLGVASTPAPHRSLGAGSTPALRRAPPCASGFGRRAICLGAGALVCAPWERAAAAPPPINTDRPRAVLRAFEKLDVTWEDATTDCRFGEVKRELLGIESKAELLEEASSFATFNKEKTMNVLCKRSTALARALVDGPSAQKVEGDLRRLAVRVPDEMEDEYLGLIESWSQMRSAASAAAFTAQTGDMSSLNTFVKGADDGGSENLVQARRNVAEGARVLRRAMEIVDPK